MNTSELQSTCEAVYRRYHHPRYISPDPLELVRCYNSLEDREIAAFIAAALALGRVDGIVKAVRWVLERLEWPTRLLYAPEAELRDLAEPFVYRFFDGEQLFGLLLGLRRVISDSGSLEARFIATSAPADREPASVTMKGLARLVDGLVEAADGRLDGSILVARPEKQSACKRLLLFLRWMVRSDSVDPGGWTVLSPAELLVPLDTHMLSVARSLGLTSARQPSLRVVQDVTEGFRAVRPNDPVRYDFSLTRAGINPQVRREIRTDPIRTKWWSLTQPA